MKANNTDYNIFFLLAIILIPLNFLLTEYISTDLKNLLFLITFIITLIAVIKRINFLLKIWHNYFK